MDDGYGGAEAYWQQRERDRLTAAENNEVERIIAQLQGMWPQKSTLDLDAKSVSMSRAQAQGVSDKENKLKSANDNEVAIISCDSLWVEAVLSQRVGDKIDISKPVKVQLDSNYTLIYQGYVDELMPMRSNNILLDNLEVNAVLASFIPKRLIGKPSNKIIVRFKEIPSILSEMPK